MGARKVLECMRFIDPAAITCEEAEAVGACLEGLLDRYHTLNSFVSKDHGKTSLSLA